MVFPELQAHRIRLCDLLRGTGSLHEPAFTLASISFLAVLTTEALMEAGLEVFQRGSHGQF